MEQGFQKLATLMDNAKSRSSRQVFNRISKRAIKVHFVRVVEANVSRSLKDMLKYGFHKLKEHLHNEHLLIRFKAAQRIYTVYEKIWRFTVNKHFNRWK